MEQQDIDISLFILVSTVTIIILVIMTISLFLFFQKKKVQYLLDKKNREARFDDELSKAQREISEQTLQNISWELHDNIGQLLSVVRLRLNMVQPSIDASLQDQIGEINGVVSNCLYEVRQLSKSLNYQYLKGIGLIQSVKSELERFDKLKFLETRFSLSGKVVPLPDKDELILFRILQEFFSNVIKHAKASHLVVTFHYDSDLLTITAEDDGVGFNHEEVVSGSGLINMRSRAALITADLDLTSGINEGVRLTIKYQLPKS